MEGEVGNDAGDGWPSHQDKVAFLSSSDTHGAAVDVRETHVAWVFLAGERAYKLKKPVRLPFLDYSTLDRRARICAEEVRLNRRLAPEVYLGTVRLTRPSAGALAIDGPGPTVEWLVSMRRLPDERMLDRAMESGSVGKAEVEAVARRLWCFYRDAEPVPVDHESHVALFLRELDKSRQVFGEDYFGRTGMRGVALASKIRRVLASGPEIVTERVARGLIVEGHGDLRPEHVCLTKTPVVIDCLEFSRMLRLVDPFDELAFLSMECAVAGARWVGGTILDLCAALLGDRPSERQLAFYTGYRAALRARQAAAHLLEPAPRTPEKWLPLAERYLDEAEAALDTLLGAKAPPRIEREGSRPVENDPDFSAQSGTTGLNAPSIRVFALGNSRELGSAASKLLGRSLDPHEERDFEDGEHKARPLVGVRGKDVYVICTLAGGPDGTVNDWMVKLLFFVGACKENGAARVTAIVPYLAYARKERQTKRRDPVTTRYVAQLFEAAGVDVLAALDVHNVAAFQNAFRCQTVHLEACPLFVPRIHALSSGLPVKIFSPDSGGVKRAELLRRRYEEATGAEAGFGFLEKHRSRGRVWGDLFAGEVAGAAVFIIDDIISSGGTACRAAQACRKRGAEKVFIMATHALFGPRSRDLLMNPAVDRILVTDSLSTAPKAARDLPDERLDIVPLAPLLAEAIRRLHGEGSISDLLGIEE